MKLLRAGLGLLAWTIACNGGPSSGPPLGRYDWTTADGCRVPYEVAGKADAEVTVVLVHCWMGNRSFWDAQVPVLAERYRTVTLDLPGHGEATAERVSWTVAGLGDDVAGLIRELGLTDVVLVGHSMGGPVALRAAARLPRRVRGIVAVDTLHDAEFEFDAEQVEAFLNGFETDFTGVCESFVEGLFGGEQGVEEIVARVRRAGCDAKRAAAGTGLMRDYNRIDFPAWFREAGVPIRAINAAEPFTTRIDVNRRYADFDAALMEGVGHYPHMTQPERFNELLLEAIAAVLAPGADG